MSSTNNFEMLERSIKSALVEFNCTMSQLASYSDIKNSRFSRGLTQEHPFSPEEKTTIESVITAMRSLQDSTTPSVPIAWANIGKLKPFIDQRRKELREQGDPIVRRCILIRTSRTGFFLRINGTNVVTTPSEMTAAAFETPDIASGVCRELKKRGT